jgi:membrane associated rhomboid family serine protease
LSVDFFGGSFNIKELWSLGYAATTKLSGEKFPSLYIISHSLTALLSHFIGEWSTDFLLELSVYYMLGRATLIFSTLGSASLKIKDPVT